MLEHQVTQPDHSLPVQIIVYYVNDCLMSVWPVLECLIDCGLLCHFQH